jgi:hypothetical protein
LRGYHEDGVVDAIREAGGEFYAVTSEPHSLALNAQKQWESDFDHIGDPHHEILADCKERDWLSLYIWQRSDGLKGPENEWVSHPNGCFQPGVLVFTREGRVLYRWRSRPSSENTGGATGRPTPTHVWNSVKTELGKPSDASDSALDNAPELDSKGAPQLLFLAMLLANGWFLKPDFFIHKTGNESQDDMMRRMRTARLRLVIFIVGWIAAFALLPIWIPTLALVGWMAIVAPKINALLKMSENTAPDE